LYCREDAQIETKCSTGDCAEESGCNFSLQSAVWRETASRGYGCCGGNARSACSRSYVCLHRCETTQSAGKHEGRAAVKQGEARPEARSPIAGSPKRRWRWLCCWGEVRAPAAKTGKPAVGNLTGYACTMTARTSYRQKNKIELYFNIKFFWV